MKLIALKPDFIYPSNGGEISFIENLLELLKRGHQVSTHAFFEAVGLAQLKSLAATENIEIFDSNYRVRELLVETHVDPRFQQHQMTSESYFRDAVFRLLDQERPDEVWVHYTDFWTAASALEWDAKRCFVRFTDNEYPRLEKFKEFPSIYRSYQKMKNIQAASPFMASELIKDFPAAQIRLLPNWIPALDKLQPMQCGEFWTFVNPVPVKGLDFMMALAQRLPGEKFLFVGNWGGSKPERLPSNVEYAQRISKIEELFARSKCLLMPSQWQEAFGRLPLEAMAAGIPVITSDRGNLPETVGTGGLVLDLSLELWLEKMKELPLIAKDLQQRGLARVKEYRVEAEAKWRSIFGERIKND